jgi:hypothetical protein
MTYVQQRKVTLAVALISISWFQGDLHPSRCASLGNSWCRRSLCHSFKIALLSRALLKVCGIRRSVTAARRGAIGRWAWGSFAGRAESLCWQCVVFRSSSRKGEVVVLCSVQRWCHRRGTRKRLVLRRSWSRAPGSHACDRQGSLLNHGAPAFGRASFHRSDKEMQS